MRNKETGEVISVEQMKEAGIPFPEFKEEEQETSYGRIHVHQQVPESGEGTYDPKTGKVEPFHRGEQERLRKAA